MNDQEFLNRLRTTQVRVGTSVIVLRGDTVLIGRRKGSHGAGNLSFPGGHLDFGESWEEGALREIMEETGLTVKYRWLSPDQEYAFVTNNIMVNDKRHYVTIFVLAEYIEGEPKLLEPNSCCGWSWMTWEEILAATPENNDDDSHHWLPKRELTILYKTLSPSSVNDRQEFSEN